MAFRGSNELRGPRGSAVRLPAPRAARGRTLRVCAAAAPEYTALQGCKVQRVSDGEFVDLLSLWQVRRAARQGGAAAFGGCLQPAGNHSSRLCGPAASRT